MKKKMLVLFLFIGSSLAFGNTYCPPKIECKNTQCSGMEGFHFGETLPGIDGTYYFNSASFNGQNPTQAMCHYVLNTKNNSCDATIIANNSLLSPNNKAPGNFWKPSGYSIYMAVCKMAPLEACPFN